MAELLVDAIVLAAGNSSRLGQNKQLLRFRGELLVRRAVRLALASGVRRVAVVTGFDAEKIEEALEGLPVTFITNIDWALGMGTSLRAAVLSAEFSDSPPHGALVLLPDQILVDGAHLTRLLETFRKHEGRGIVATSYGSPDAEQGAPTIFACPFFRALAELAPAAGARRLLARYEGHVRLVPCVEAGVDVDTTADLERLRMLEGSTAQGETGRHGSI